MPHPSKAGYKISDLTQLVSASVEEQNISNRSLINGARHLSDQWQRLMVLIVQELLPSYSLGFQQVFIIELNMIPG